jgi:methylamine dehydrogenase heavy chain
MRRALGLALGLVLIGGAARAELSLEQTGRIASLPEPFGAHWAWVSDVVLRRTALIDLDGGSMLGMLSSGYGSFPPVFPRNRPEIYLPETYYSRGSRGERTDLVSFYDARTLAPVNEVLLPPKRAINALPIGNAALSDDERFLAVFNMTPATSLSIVDVERRSFVGEIATPGCSLAYGAGARRFLMLCADGAALTLTLGEDGSEAGKVRSEPFFDPQTDPVMEKAVRSGDTWVFVSFDGVVHPIRVGGETIEWGEPWRLFDEADTADSWRVGGVQPLAVHTPSHRLYVLVHQGGPGSHKAPGSEVWVYDLEGHRRLQKIELRSPGITYLGEPLAFGHDWIWPFNHLDSVVLDSLPPRVAQISVTRDAERPLLVTSSEFGGSLGIYDARSGEWLRRVSAGGLTTQVLQTPWEGPP